MPPPQEVAWIVPIVIPFILGFLIGAIVKRAFKFILGVLVIIFFLTTTGYMNLTFEEIYNRTVKTLSKIMSSGSTTVNTLHYSLVMFGIGLILGLLKG